MQERQTAKTARPGSGVATPRAGRAAGARAGTRAAVPASQQAPSFECDSHDFRLIARIVDRALALFTSLGGDPCRRQDLLMDLVAAHVNGCPLRLRELLAAPDADFGHDVFGIRRFLDRSTGRLTGQFIPRFAQPESR